MSNNHDHSHEHSHEHGHSHCNHSTKYYQDEHEKEPLLDHNHNNSDVSNDTTHSSSVTAFFSDIRYGLRSKVLQTLTEFPGLANEFGNISIYFNYFS